MAAKISEITKIPDDLPRIVDPSGCRAGITGNIDLVEISASTEETVVDPTIGVLKGSDDLSHVVNAIRAMARSAVLAASDWRVRLSITLHGRGCGGGLVLVIDAQDALL